MNFINTCFIYFVLIFRLSSVFGLIKHPYFKVFNSPIHLIPRIIPENSIFSTAQIFAFKRDLPFSRFLFKSFQRMK
jgi:hypothetical protein